jgi:CBS domain-containing protein
MRVAEIMTRDVVAVSGDATLTEAAELMRKHHIGFLPVVTADMAVGVVTDRDIVVRGLGEGRNAYLTLVRAVMSTRPVWCYDDDVLTGVADILARNRMRRLVVVDNNNKLSGLVSIDDVATHMNSDRLLSELVRQVSAA